MRIKAFGVVAVVAVKQPPPPAKIRWHFFLGNTWNRFSFTKRDRRQKNSKQPHWIIGLCFLWPIENHNMGFKPSKINPQQSHQCYCINNILLYLIWSLNSTNKVESVILFSSILHSIPARQHCCITHSCKFHEIVASVHNTAPMWTQHTGLTSDTLHLTLARRPLGPVAIFSFDILRKSEAPYTTVLFQYKRL